MGIASLLLPKHAGQNYHKSTRGGGGVYLALPFSFSASCFSHLFTIPKSTLSNYAGFRYVQILRPVCCVKLLPAASCQLAQWPPTLGSWQCKREKYFIMSCSLFSELLFCKIFTHPPPPNFVPSPLCSAILLLKLPPPSPPA